VSSLSPRACPESLAPAPVYSQLPETLVPLAPGFHTSSPNLLPNRLPTECCTVLYCTALHCTALHCTVLYCTVLYCTGLFLSTVLYLPGLLGVCLGSCLALGFRVTLEVHTGALYTVQHMSTACSSEMR